jgi:hypothetical protein
MAWEGAVVCLTGKGRTRGFAGRPGTTTASNITLSAQASRSRHMRSWAIWRMGGSLAEATNQKDTQAKVAGTPWGKEASDGEETSTLTCFGRTVSLKGCCCLL